VRQKGISYNIRPYAAPDSGSLIAAINAVCGEGRWMSTPCYQPTPAWRHALDTPACPTHSLVIVEDNSRIVGWCRTFPDDGRNRQAELGIGLLPAYRNRGVGTYLVRQSLAWAKNVGLNQVVLTATVDNSRALRVFKKCRFQTLTTINGRVRMACRLR